MEWQRKVKVPEDYDPAFGWNKTEYHADTGVKSFRIFTGFTSEKGKRQRKISVNVYDKVNGREFYLGVIGGQGQLWRGNRGLFTLVLRNARTLPAYMVADLRKAAEQIRRHRVPRYPHEIVLPAIPEVQTPKRMNPEIPARGREGKR
jgi:hypothetical protein